MPLLIDYILKLNICLAVVYLFYQLFLRKLTFYNWNRWYLLGYTTLSFIIPLIDIMPSLEKRALQQNLMVQWIPAISFATPGERNFFETLTYWDWAVAVLILGSLVLLVRFLVRFYSFKKMKAKAQLISGQDTMIYQLDEPITPFSFGNAIFINTEMHSGEDLEEIIRHEFVHVKQRHTIDIMWCEMLCMLNWFNPFVWLLRHNVKQNLEFIADSKVLQSGLDRKEYQYLLLKVMGNRQFAFTNHFNFSSLKKRIVMMNTIKSAKVQLIKFMFLLPVVAVLLLSFRKEMKAYQEKVKIDAAHSNEAEFKNIVFSNGSETDVVWVKDTLPATTAEKTPAIKIRNQISLSNPEKKPLIIVDGDRKDNNYDLDVISPNDIESINILKDASAIAQFGEGAENGVISITTKGSNTKMANIKLRSVEAGKTPLYILDGQPLSSTSFKSIDPNDIGSITVLKNESAKQIYGAEAENGVIIVTSKKLADKVEGFKTDSLKEVVVVGYGTNSGTNLPLKGKVAGVQMQSAERTGNLKEVSVVGYGTKTAASTSLRGKVEGVQIQPAKRTSNLEEVVVVGYGTKTADNPSLEGKAAGLRVVPSGKSASRLEAVTVKGYPTQRFKDEVNYSKFDGKQAQANVLANPPQNAYYVLNGESVSVKKIRNLDQASIKSFDVLKGENAKKYYGSKAKEGAIVITTN